MGALLSREAILAADDLKFEDVPVPEWGGSVRVRQMTAAERAGFQEATFGKGQGKLTADPNAYRLNLVVHTAVGEDGKRLFTLEDVQALDAKNSNAVDRVAQVADRLNTVTEAKVEEAQKNS